MQKLGGIGNVWSTVKEINVSEIRESADQSIQLALIGPADLRADVIRALHAGPSRYPSAQRATIYEFDMSLPRDRQGEVSRSDLAILAIDARKEVSQDVAALVDKLSIVSIPRVLLFVGTDRVPAVAGGGALYVSDARTVFVPDTGEATLAKRLMPVIVDQMPEDQRIAAARRLPGLRDGVGRWLVGDVSFSNATYALTSGIPEMVPLLNIPLNAADMVVLTKNQALLVYKLALAFGAPADFQAQMREVLPVIGSGFLWRQVARQLVGLIPGFGILPKVAVAYAGTYATGQAAALWYRSGEQLSNAALKQLYRQAFTVGRERARELIQRRKEAATTIDVTPRPAKQRWWQRLFRWRRK